LVVDGHRINIEQCALQLLATVHLIYRIFFKASHLGTCKNH